MANQTAMTAFENRFSPAKVAPGAFADDNDVILFTHIPKTAGMSVGKALQGAFDRFYPVSWQNTAKSFRFQTREALYHRTQTPLRRVLMGHFAWSEINFWKVQELPVKAASIIRDPLARTVSNYNYNCSEKHPANAQFKERFPTLEEYAENLPQDYQLHTMIGMFYSFDHALEKLASYYSFIGVTEHLGASLAHFGVSHGLEGLEEHRENQGMIPASNEQITDEVRNIVMEKSHNDNRLHELLMNYYA